MNKEYPRRSPYRTISHLNQAFTADNEEGKNSAFYLLMDSPHDYQTVGNFSRFPRVSQEN